MANACFNSRMSDARFVRSTRGFSQTRPIDAYIPTTDPRLIDVTRGLHLSLDSPPMSGFVSDRVRYCDSKDTPKLGWNSREDNHSSWQYYLTENQSKPFNPVIYGENYKATLSEFQDPMGSQKTEYILTKRRDFPLNDIQDEQLSRLTFQSKLQSKMDEQKFGPKLVVSRNVSCDTIIY